MKIAIASGKGGTGKTFVSTNFFWVANQKGVELSLIDCDAEEPNVAEFMGGELTETKDVSQMLPVIDSESCVFCGKCVDYCSYNAIFYLPALKNIQLTEDLCHSCGACLVACEHAAITEISKSVGTIKTFTYSANSNLIESRMHVGINSPVPIIKEGIKASGVKSLALLDSPPGISCPFIATVENADYVVLVTEPTPFGLNDLRLSVETLRSLDIPCGVVINRAGLGDLGVYSWLQKEQIPILLEIPFDKNIAKLYSEGNIVSEYDETIRNQFNELLEKIVEQAI